MKKFLAVLLAGLSIGGLYFIYIFKTQGGNLYDSLESVVEENLSEVVSVTPTASNERGFGFSVGNVTSGSSVVVSTMNTSVPVFVVVSNQKDGLKGDVIGHSDLIKEGFHQNVEVFLDQKISGGEVIYIEAVSDNGNQEYGDLTDITIREDVNREAIEIVTVSS